MRNSRLVFSAVFGVARGRLVELVMQIGIAWSALAILPLSSTPALALAAAPRTYLAVERSAGPQSTGQINVAPDSITLRGSVTTGRSRPIAGASVIVRQTDGVFADSVRTDSSGRYSVAIPEGSRGKLLLVTVTAPGFAPSRTVVASLAGAHNVQLASPSQALAAVRVVGTRERPALPQNLAPDIGGLANAASGTVSGLASGSYSGDVLGFAAGSPTVDVTRSALGRVIGVTTMGLGASQTSLSVDGADVRSISIPQNAHVAIQVATSLYDPSQGGFSGVKIDVTAAPGNNIGSRSISASGTANVTTLAPSATVRASGAASGYLILDHLMYSSSAELSRTSAPSQLFDTREGTGPSGVTLSEADATTLNNALRQIGITRTPAAQQAVTNSFSTLNRFDFVSDSDHSIALIARLATDATTHGGGSPAAIGDLFGNERSTDAGLTLQRSVLSDRAAQKSVLAVSNSVDQQDPSYQLPLIRLRVPGELNGIASAQNAITGSSIGTASASRWTSLNGSHTVYWVSADGHHHSDAGLSLRFVRESQDPRTNQFGVVSFDSLSSFVSQTPSAYSRDFNVARSSANVATMSGFLGDQWVLRPHLSMQGGARVDLNQYSIANASANATATSAALGLNSSATGHSLDVSPRLGATWDVPVSSTKVAMLSFRGGVGRFVNDVRSTSLLPAAVPFVGSGSLQRLDCTGANIPSLDWSSINAATVPGSCNDGTLPVLENVTGSVFATDWKPAASWRGNIGGSVQFQKPWTLSFDYTRNVTTRISSSFAGNLAPGPVFTLASEAGRPVFADGMSLSSGAAYGTVIPLRITNNLGGVNYIMSDMRSSANQYLIGLRYLALTGTVFQVQYAHTDARELTRGADGLTAGDPRVASRSPTASPTDVVTLRTFRRVGSHVSIEIDGRLQSGMRYTPLVFGDVNGDGRFDDRAYVARSSDADSVVANGIGRLLTTAPSGASACLRNSLGTIAGRNSCVGPWTASLDGTVLIPVPAVRSHAMLLQLDIFNAISGLDAALHGTDRMRGWGGYGMPDNTLLTATGYNASARRYTYLVNPAFGSVRSSSASQKPFGVRLSLSVAFGRDRAEQQLVIDATRRTHPSTTALINRYVAQYPNVGFEILRAADSVGLSKTQRDSVTAIGRAFDETLRTIWRPVAEQIHAGLSVVDAARVIAAARTPAAINYEAYAAMTRAVLTDNQFARLPEDAKWFLASGALRSMGLAP